MFSSPKTASIQIAAAHNISTCCVAQWQKSTIQRPFHLAIRPSDREKVCIGLHNPVEIGIGTNYAASIMNRLRRKALKQIVGSGLASVLAVPVSRAGDGLVPISTTAVPPSFQGKQRPYTHVAPAYPAPLTPMYTAAGEVINLRRFQGQVVLLNFWATWCPPCLYELPSLSRLQASLGGDDFTVLTLNVDELNPAGAAGYLVRLGIKNLPLLYDPKGRMPTAFKTHHGLPWSFVIDRRGFVQGYMMGDADWNSDDAKRLLTYYMR